jgi:hypothetical protein
MESSSSGDSEDSDVIIISHSAPSKRARPSRKIVKQARMDSYFGNNNNNASSVRLQQQFVLREEHWTYFPEALNDIDFQELYELLLPLVHGYTYTSPETGLSYPSKRLSCRLVDHDPPQVASKGEGLQGGSTAFDYGELKRYNWNRYPLLKKIKERLDEVCEEKYNELLVHLYRDGDDEILYHSDKEAWSSSVGSLSFGAGREFCIRDIEATSGTHKRFYLQHGDVLKMLPTMQRNFLHAVPKTTQVDRPRFNFTGRKLDKTYPGYTKAQQFIKARTRKYGPNGQTIDSP